MAILTRCGYPKVYRLDGDGSADGVLKELNFLIQTGKINPENFDVVKLRYSAKKGLGGYDTDEYYPLKFLSADKEVWISSVKPGSTDDDSKAIIRAFALMRFPTEKKKKAIIYYHKSVDLTYKKDIKSQP